LFKNDSHLASSLADAILILGVGEESQQARSLNGRGQLSLVKSTGAGYPPRGNFPSVKDALFQNVDVLIIYIPQIPLAETTELPLRRKIPPVTRLLASLFSGHF
jgi:hypothetical protein